MAPPRVLFIHGQESSAQGRKARLLAEHFEALTPAMDTSDFEACVARQAEAIRRFQPDVVVGSSFGGGVALALLQRGAWRGPTLLLAQAGLRQSLRAELPVGVPVWLVHGTRDDVVPIEDSRVLARSGSRELVRLLEVDDDHPLSRLVELVGEIATAPAGPTGLARHLAVMLDEPMLWPVLIVVAAHVVLFGALIMLMAFRTRSPFGVAALLVLVVVSIDAIRREQRFGLLTRSTVGFWVLAALAAAVGAHFGVF